jgi:hypothetical protein
MAMSSESSARCIQRHSSDLRPARLSVTLSYDGQSCQVDEDDGLFCAACGDEYIGERAAAFLLSHRALAPQADRSVTVIRRTASG